MIEPFPVIDDALVVPRLLRRSSVLPLLFLSLFCIAVVFLFPCPGLAAESSPDAISLSYMVDQSTDIVTVSTSSLTVEQRTKPIQGEPPYTWNVYHVTIAEMLKPRYGAKAKKGKTPGEIDISFYDEKAYIAFQRQYDKGARKDPLPGPYKTSVTDVSLELQRGGMIFFLQQRDGVYYLQNPAGFESLAAVNRIKELVKAAEIESDSGCGQ